MMYYSSVLNLLSNMTLVIKYDRVFQIQTVFRKEIFSKYDLRLIQCRIMYYADYFKDIN